jgi:MFS family permease
VSDDAGRGPRSGPPGQEPRDPTSRRLALFGLIVQRDWVTLAGYLFYVALMTAGYYYNLTFVQLGLIDLGTTRLGMTGASVSLVMAMLALVALAASVATGVLMDHRGWSGDLRIRLRLLFVVTAVQLALTVAAPLLAAPTGFVVWVVVCAASIGVGMPVTFSFMADLVPVRDRGFAAAVPAGLAFFIAALYPQEWRIEQFSAVMAAAMAPAVVVLAVLAFRPTRSIEQLAQQQVGFGPGRFTRPPAPTASTGMFALVVTAMFAVFFIDSLGFLRIIDTPAYISTSWQSPDLRVRLFIAVAHVVGAAIAGVLYTTFDWRWLLVWVYGLFGFTHLLYVFHLATGAGAAPPLVLPGMYVLAVSFYTTLNFALWPDLSTPDTIGTRCAVGVGVAGWLASFLSTALALVSDAAGVTLLTHLRYVDALALLLVAVVPLLLYTGRVRALARQETP